MKKSNALMTLVILILFAVFIHGAALLAWIGGRTFYGAKLPILYMDWVALFALLGIVRLFWYLVGELPEIVKMFKQE